MISTALKSGRGWSDMKSEVDKNMNPVLMFSNALPFMFCIKAKDDT